MIFIGIDPGLSGGIAFLGAGRIEAVPMPVLPGKKKAYDIQGVTSVIHEALELAAAGKFGICAVIEDLQPNPKWGKGTFGKINWCKGMFETIFTIYGISYELAVARKWQKEIHASLPVNIDTKTKSILTCRRLFPNVSLKATLRSKKDHDGMADALCIAEYCRRRFGR